MTGPAGDASAFSEFNGSDSTGAPDPTGVPGAVWRTFEQMPIIMGGFHGPSHVFDATNAAYREWMGRSNVIGIPAAEVFPELVGQELFTMFDRVAATEEASFLREWRFQADLTATGELQEFFVDVVIAPRRESEGQVSGLTLWGVNVTDRVVQRRASERAREQAQQRYEAARDVVVELQQTLLAASVPVLPSVDVAARYVVASQDQAAGGDWFDAVPLPDGSVAAVVGDVVGHGVAASAAMGQLRSVLATALVETGDLALAMRWADRMAARTPAMRAATVCATVLNPSTGVLRYATCGHPPPLIIGDDRSTRYLEPSGSGPLGTSSEVIIAADVLQAGEVLLLFTDGLVEQPGRGVEQGMTALARVAANAAGNLAMPLDGESSTVERVCQQSVELMTRFGHDDDVTALAVQRRLTPVPVLRHDTLAVADAVTAVRAALQEWFIALRLRRDDRLRIELAVTELVANAVEHAYPIGRPGPVRVTADLGADGVLRVRVADDGVWREPVGPHDRSGRGLWMVGTVLDELHLDHRVSRSPDALTEPSTGTTVTVRHALRQPATLVPDAAVPPDGRPVAPFTAVTDTGSPRTLRVSGSVDIVTSAVFAERVEVASRGGMHPVTVDLRDLDVLGSAGVRVLFNARDQHDIHGHVLDVVVRAGGPVQQVLELVGLPHRVP